MIRVKHSAFGAAVTLLLLGAPLVGCGGGSDSGASPSASSAPSGSTGSGGAPTLETASLNKAEYVKQAEEICIAGNEDLLPEITTYLQKHESHPGQSEGEVVAAAVQHAVVPKLQLEVDKLYSLGAPAGDEQQLEAFLTAMLKATEDLESRNELTLEPGLSRVLGHAGDLALNYGIQNCAN